ncbi:MAG: class I mannose-6-phosphate isomerase [Clostridiales bacterium]|nr:class I mannose-6-phosphate isomerase [Clostridiales bacterium]
MKRYPMKLKAAVFENIWGGTRLMEEYGIKTDKANAAEAWMLSCNKDGYSVIENGDYAGKTLQDVFEADRSIAGFHDAEFSKFPVLIKFIDARGDLSVQVHPDDTYAQYIGEGDGKTECWYILDCEEDAELIVGFKKEISESEFLDSIAQGTLIDCVQKFKVKKGDFFFIEAGTLHAICSGVLLAEVQQNSNTTYRIFDYNRLDKDGLLRPLRVDDAVQVTRREPYRPSRLPEPPEDIGIGARRTNLVSCEFFISDVLDIYGSAEGTANSSSFVSLLVLEGIGELACAGETMGLTKGESVFIPADCGDFRVAGNLKILETRI